MGVAPDTKQDLQRPQKSYILAFTASLNPKRINPRCMAAVPEFNAVICPTPK
jgi:hypothetical protein